MTVAASLEFYILSDKVSSRCQGGEHEANVLSIRSGRFRKSAMKTFVEFRSKKFPPYDGEENELNPGLWGKRLAEYFIAKLPEQGIEPNDLIPEDWGWCVPIKSDGVRFALCCGHQYGDDDEFQCFTDPEQPITKQLFKKIDATAELKRLIAAMNEILSKDPDITGIVWREL